MIRKNAGRDAVMIQLLIVAAVVFIVFFSFVGAFAYQHMAHPLPLNPNVLIERYRVYLIPKPEERAIFLALAFSVPVACFVACIWIFGRARSFGAIQGYVLPAVLGLAFLITFSRFDFGSSLLVNGPASWEHVAITLAASSFIATSWFVWKIRNGFAAQRKAGQRISWTIFAASVALQLCAWRLVNRNSIDITAAWHVSADPVLYAIAQVVGGKTLLSDLPSQYGLYPEMLAPIFKIIGLSLAHFSAVCALMQIVSMFAIAYVLHHEVRDPALRIAALLSLVMVTFETCLWLLKVDERYFQYWPMRFFWPSLSVLVFYQYSKSKTFGRAAIVSFVASVGSLWNADSGLMIFLAFAAFLLAKWVFLFLNDRYATVAKRSHLVIGLVFHFLIFFVLTALFLGYLSIKAAQPMHWSWLFESQKLFYGLGFAMIPLPLQVHPWMAVMAVYLSAFIVSCAGLTRHPHSSSLDIVLYLSLLGLGLFVYYEGRSHILNLITISWPAVILSALLADRLVRGMRAKILGKELVIVAACALSILTYCAIPLVIGVPKLIRDSVSSFADRGRPSNALVGGDIQFFIQHSHHGEECVIMSLRQGIYEVETGLISPLSGPGYGETLLQADIDFMITQIRAKLPACLFLGVGPTSAIDLAGNKLDFLDRYREVARSPAGTMVLYRRSP